MNVKQLIEKLSLLNEDLMVCYTDNDHEFISEIHNVVADVFSSDQIRMVLLSYDILPEAAEIEEEDES